VLYDVSTLYFEADADEGSREPGRRLEPQITISLLTGQDWFHLLATHRAQPI